MKRDNSIRIFEIIAILITGIGKFLFIDIYNLKFWYIAAACIGWALYIGLRVRKEPGILDYFGFRRDGLKSSLKIILPIALIAVITFIIIGLAMDRLVLSWHIIPIMLLYPIWGTIQQFLMISLIASNIRDLEGNFKFSNLGIVAIVSVLFAIVHYPSYELIGSTFLLAILYTFIFLRYRNIWVQGLFHGWLGCFFYFFVLGRDPWLELFNSL